MLANQNPNVQRQASVSGFISGKFPVLPKLIILELFSPIWAIFWLESQKCLITAQGNAYIDFRGNSAS